MKLQILIPHYTETEAEIAPLLDSIALQQSVAFGEIGVIVCHDGNEAQNFDGLKRYPFAIEQIRQEHRGVSAARNACLDAATADYVMFCDADDMFCDVCGLHIILRETEHGGFDTFVSRFREETRLPDGQPVYIDRENDLVFVHGKVHRRAYLVENRIRWNESLTIHEDSFFNILCRELSAPGRAKYCPMPFYLWRWRDASVCRHDPDYLLKTYPHMLDSNDALVDEFVRRMREDKANASVGMMVFDAYYTLNKPSWLDKTNAAYRETVERRFAAYWAKHRAKFEALTAQERMMISQAVRQRSAAEGMLMEALTLQQWLEDIERKIQ